MAGTLFPAFGDLPAMECGSGACILFVHIPKTAGTSLRDLLCCHFARAGILALEREETQGERVKKLKALQSSQFVHGHIPYSIVDRFVHRPTVVTILRNPLERAVSAFYYMRWKVKTGCLPALSTVRMRDYMAADRLPLGDFIREEPIAAARHLGNLQAWFLSTPDTQARFDFKDEYNVIVSDADLERAKDNLRCCDVVGISERMQDSAELLAYALRFRPLGAVGTANVGPLRPPLSELDTQTLAKLTELTSQDRKLYVFACALFEERRQAMMRDLLMRNAEGGGEKVPGKCELPVVLAFDHAIPGEGWYAPEQSGDLWFSWTGPAKISNLEFRLPAGSDVTLRIWVRHAMDWKALEMIDIRVNGVRVSIHTSRDDSGAILTGRVISSLLRRGEGDYNLFEIRTQHTLRPSDKDASSQDSRLLGIAVARVELRSD